MIPSSVRQNSHVTPYPTDPRTSNWNHQGTFPGNPALLPTTGTPSDLGKSTDESDTEQPDEVAEGFDNLTGFGGAAAPGSAAAPVPNAPAAALPAGNIPGWNPFTPMQTKLIGATVISTCAVFAVGMISVVQARTQASSTPIGHPTGDHFNQSWVPSLTEAAQTAISKCWTNGTAPEIFPGVPITTDSAAGALANNAAHVLADAGLTNATQAIEQLSCPPLNGTENAVVSLATIVESFTQQLISLLPAAPAALSGPAPHTGSSARLVADVVGAMALTLALHTLGLF